MARNQNATSLKDFCMRHHQRCNTISPKDKDDKHTLTKDCKRRTEKYRLWEEHAQHINIDPTERVKSLSLRMVHDSGSSPDSETWIQAS